MKKIIASIFCISFVIIAANCDTVTHVYGKDPNVTGNFVTDPSEIEPDVEPIFETKAYNQGLVTIGFFSVLVGVSGFVYLLTKKRH